MLFRHAKIRPARACLLAVVTILLSAAAQAWAGAAYYLSPSGSDSAACTLQAPCATVAHAQHLMRGTATKTTYLLDGTYALPAPLILNANDDGETFANYPDQVPRLTPAVSAFSTPIFINGASHVIISGLALSNTQAAASDGGDCIQFNGGNANTMRQAAIGPCFGHGVHVTGGSFHRIVDSYIHTDNRPTADTCCDVNEGVRVEGQASHIYIAGNVIAFSESNIEVVGSNHVTADGNFLLNPLGPFPRGQNFQSSSATNVKVTRNYALSSQSSAYPFKADQEDSINFYYTPSPLAQGNYVSGGISPSGCAIIADDHTSGAHFLGNTIYNTGECGIGISTGRNHVVSGNRVLDLDPVNGGGNVGIYVANYAAPYPCGNITITNNIATAILSKCDPATQTCSYNGYYPDSSCSGVTATNNIFDYDDIAPPGGAAYLKLINVVPGAAPLVPPVPVSCVARSPYSTQTSVAKCR